MELTSAVGHSHDLEFLDAVKRCSGVRGIVLDPFFKSWEAGGILAYLKDSAAGVVESGDGEGEHQDGAGGGATSSGSEFVDAGGLHICRQEVQNILNSAIRRAHPGQDVSFVKKQMDKYKKFVTCTNKGCNASAFPDIRALMEHRKQAHGVKIHDHSDKLYGCPDKTCWRKKKSKGFSTLLSLEEHVKEKHPERVTADGLDLGENGGVLPVSEDVLTPTENGGEFATVHSTMSNGQHQTPDKGFRSDLFSPEDGRFGGYGGYGAMQVDTPQHQRNHQVEPITPDSTAALEAQMIAELSAPAEAEMSQPPSIEPQAPTPLTYAERQKMKLRISQLKAERVKLDNEIARLTRRVWPNEGVETGGAQENG